MDSSDEEDIWWDTSSRDALDLSLTDRNGLSWSKRKDDFVDNPSGGGQADVESAPVDAEQLSDIRQRTNSRQISYEEPPKEALASFKTSRRTSHEKKVHRRKSMFSMRSSSDLSKRGTRAATLTAVQVVSRDANDFKDERERKNNLHWQGVAERIDEVSRIFIPLSYMIFLGVVMSRANF